MNVNVNNSMFEKHTGRKQLAALIGSFRVFGLGVGNKQLNPYQTRLHSPRYIGASRRESRIKMAPGIKISLLVLSLYVGHFAIISSQYLPEAFQRMTCKYDCI